jgi:hypothetical protein
MPNLTGSLPKVKTIGTVVVAALAAATDGKPPLAAISATGRLTNSRASIGSRSY